MGSTKAFGAIALFALSAFAGCAVGTENRDEANARAAASSAVTAEDSVTVPIIAVACKAFADRASTFDCASASAVRDGSVTFEADTTEADQRILLRKEYLRLSALATEDCGGADLCRGAYGVFGEQCIAIAQSSFYSGFGSFMGKETTQTDAEATAVRDCRLAAEACGVDGDADCQVLISRCPAGI
jgi:hypothetical protein